jgi:hypothetical protein
MPQLKTADVRPQRSRSMIHLRSHFIPTPFRRLYSGSTAIEVPLVCFSPLVLFSYSLTTKQRTTYHLSRLMYSVDTTGFLNVSDIVTVAVIA